MILLMDKAEKLNILSEESIIRGIEDLKKSHGDKGAYINGAMAALLLMDAAEQDDWAELYTMARKRAKRFNTTTLEEIRRLRDALNVPSAETESKNLRARAAAKLAKIRGGRATHPPAPPERGQASA